MTLIGGEACFRRDQQGCWTCRFGLVFRVGSRSRRGSIYIGERHSAQNHDRGKYRSGRSRTVFSWRLLQCSAQDGELYCCQLSVAPPCRTHPSIGLGGCTARGSTGFYNCLGWCWVNLSMLLSRMFPTIRLAILDYELFADGVCPECQSFPCVRQKEAKKDGG